MIINEPKIKDQKDVNLLRSATEHRAMIMLLMAQEAKKRGLDLEFVKDAAFGCGCVFKGMKPDTDDLKTFAESVFTEDWKTVYEQDIDINEEEVNVRFGYCPLVAGWSKITSDEETICDMCDAAMYGDRGMFSNPKFDFQILKTIAEGNDHCHIQIKKKKPDTE